MVTVSPTTSAWPNTAAFFVAETFYPLGTATPFRPDIILDEEVLKVEMDRYTRFFNMFL